MKNENYEKFKQAYKKLSTPAERFSDLVEKMEDALESLDPEKLKGRDGDSTDPKSVALEVMKMVRDGRDGKDAVVDYEYITKRMLGEFKQKRTDLSIFDLKDWEEIYRQPGNVIGGNALGLTKVYTDATLTGDGTQASPLHVVGGTGGGVVSLNGLNGVINLINGGNVSFGIVGNDISIQATGAGFSPYTIQNATSIFSTGLPGLWTSPATNSFISGFGAGNNNAGPTDGVVWIGTNSGGSDLSQVMTADYSVFLGFDSGFNAFRAQNTVALGNLAGAYASDASYSFFAGAQAGISATYAGNSFFFGQAAGHNATNATASIFMGLEAGYDAANAANSNFLGYLSGFQATNANNSTFMGARSGFQDVVDNRGTITYTAPSGNFGVAFVITSTSGGTATVLSDDLAGTLRISTSTGTFAPGDTITQTTTGTTATVATYVPSTASVLIGDFTSTGGGVNSVAIGAHSSNAGFSNSIVIGVGGLNTMDNQYAWGDAIVNWRFAGNSYALPLFAPSGTEQYLGVMAGNQLFWGVPGATVNSLAVLAASTVPLPNATNYSNGAAGVGATITSTVNGVLVVDGITPALNDRILVKDQLLQLENGVYSLTTVGDVGTPYQLTRTTDADVPSQFNDMVVIPAQGLTQSATPYGQQSVVTAIGTSSIVFIPQTSIYVRQETSGTQVANQIPIYTGTAKTITKGTADFTYDPVTHVLVLDSTTFNSVIGYGALTSSSNVRQSVVIGKYAGFKISDTYLANIIGDGAGGTNDAANVTGSSFFGAEAGFAGSIPLALNYMSNFFGFFAGNGTVTAANSTFIGNFAGLNDTVDNTNVMTLSGVTGTFSAGDFVFGATGSGYVAVGGTTSITVIPTDPLPFTGTVDNGAGATGTFVSITGSHSVLIGDFSSTGGFKDSVAIGTGATNTAANQFLIGSSYTPNMTLAEYVNNAAAAAVLPVGSLYQTTVAGDAFVKRVI